MSSGWETAGTPTRTRSTSRRWGPAPPGPLSRRRTGSSKPMRGPCAGTGRASSGRWQWWSGRRRAASRSAWPPTSDGRSSGTAGSPSSAARRASRPSRVFARIRYGATVTDDSSDCLFCRIVKGEIPADVVLENEACVAFRDINPQAPVHVLVVPRAHHRDLAAVATADPELTVRLVATCTEVAESEGLPQPGYRIVFNTGSGAGQTVFHAHGHVLGGRPMTWPPG